MDDKAPIRPVACRPPPAVFEAARALARLLVAQEIRKAVEAEKARAAIPPQDKAEGGLTDQAPARPLPEKLDPLPD